MPTSRSQADRGGFKILWARAPRQFESDSRQNKFFYVGLSEWSKEPGLGPGMFACAAPEAQIPQPTNSEDMV